MANSGFETDAGGAEALFVRNFDGFDYIVGPSGSCTAPPSEWPAGTTGPSYAAMTCLARATSSANEVREFCTDTTCRPLAWSNEIILLQSAASAKAPWTSTTFFTASVLPRRGTVRQCHGCVNLPCVIILHRKSIEDELPFRTGTAAPALVRRSGQRTDSLSEKSYRLCDDTLFVIDELETREC
jgi:hypothetical protein